MVVLADRALALDRLLRAGAMPVSELGLSDKAVQSLHDRGHLRTDGGMAVVTERTGIARDRLRGLLAAMPVRLLA